MDAKQVLGIVAKSLSVVQQLGSVPGVNIIPYVATITSAAGVLHQLIDTEQEFEPLALALAGTFKDGTTPPADEAVASLVADTKSGLDKLRAMPPKEDGETD